MMSNFFYFYTLYISEVMKLKFENNQQGKDNRDRDDQGMMDKIGDKIENMVDSMTGNDQDMGQQQKGRNRDSNR